MSEKIPEAGQIWKRAILEHHLNALFFITQVLYTHDDFSLVDGIIRYISTDTKVSVYKSTNMNMNLNVWVLFREY